GAATAWTHSRRGPRASPAGSHTRLRSAKVLAVSRSNRAGKHHVRRRSKRVQHFWAAHAALLSPAAGAARRSSELLAAHRAARVGCGKVSGPAFWRHAAARGDCASADGETSNTVDGRSFQRSRSQHSQGHAAVDPQTLVRNQHHGPVRYTKYARSVVSRHAHSCAG